MIGVYSGTRPGTCLQLRWLPSTNGGWVDLDSETLHHRALGAQSSNKRQPPVRIHRRLLPHLKRWMQADMSIEDHYVRHQSYCECAYSFRGLVFFLGEPNRTYEHLNATLPIRLSAAVGCQRPLLVLIAHHADDGGESHPMRVSVRGSRLH